MPARLAILMVLVCAACGTTRRRDLPVVIGYDDGPRKKDFMFSDADAALPEGRLARLERRTFPATMLPIKPGITSDAAEVERGLGLTDVLMHALGMMGRSAEIEDDETVLAGDWARGLGFFFSEPFFATSEERQSWVESADPAWLPSRLGKSKYRFVVGGNLHAPKAGEPRTVTLWLMDRMEKKLWSGSATVDYPRLQRPRLLLVRLLTDAGYSPPEMERGDMLWTEELDDDDLRLVGHAGIEQAWGDFERTRKANELMTAGAPWSWVAWIDTAMNGFEDDCAPERREALNRAFSINPRADFLATSAALGCEVGMLIEQPEMQIFEGMKRMSAANCSVAGKAIAMIGGGREVPGSGFLAGLGGFYRGGTCSEENYADLALLAERATDAFVKGGLYLDAGTIAIGSGDLKKARKHFENAKAALLSLQEPYTCLPRMFIAETELHLGGVSLQEGQLDEAEQAASRAQALGDMCTDPRIVGRALNLKGLIAQAGSRYGDALKVLEQALAIFEDLGDEMNVAVAKTNIGWTRVLLNQADVALPWLQDALRLKERVRSNGGVAVALENLGVAYMTLGRFGEAEPLFERARGLTKDMGSLAAICSNLARIRAGQGRHDEARALLAEARGYAVKVHARALTAQIGQTEGGLEAMRGNLEAAMKAFNEALVIRREVGDRAGEGLTLSSLMVVAARLEKDDLAILYGKLAVQAHQDVKKGAAEIDKQAEESFAKSREQTYRRLAELLVKNGRLIEAERVLRLMKVDEAEEWTRAGSDDKTTITLTKNEEALEQAYKAVADDVMAIGRDYGALASKYPLTKDEEAKLAGLRAKLEATNAKFSEFLESLANKPIASKNIDDLREGVGIGPDLAELPGTVVVYTLIADESLIAMVVSSDTQVAETIKFPLIGFDFNDVIARFRAALQDPRADPKPLGKQLYDQFIAPIAKHIVAAKATTVLWSLDRTLRYVPMGAIWDGKKYLAERWQNAVFTLTSRARLKDAPQSKWRVLAAGVSKGTEGFKPLPAVVDELDRIVDDAATRDNDGALPGVTMLDDGFERDAFINALGAKWPVVHIASHFSFAPGDKDQSFLVMGKGRLTVSELERIPFLFTGVDLLTLSACNTATGDEDSDKKTGREVESFAVLAQTKGARAVLATLWPVADGSTSVLMQRFYVLHQQGMSKAAALRAAQLELLSGKVTAESSGVRGPRPLTADAPVDEPKPEKADWRHPYYWAPFVLIGNPR